MRAALTAPSPTAARGVFAGLCATLVGIGLARFAYAPLLPALVEAGWLTSGEAAYLGAANLIGYLAGAMGTARLVRLVPLRPLLQATMLLAAFTFLACAADLGFYWFLPWRFLSGAAGGVLMVAAAPAVLAAVEPQRRGRAVGIVFAGVGIGIVAAGTVLPVLLRGGPVTAWLGLGLASLLLAAAAWRSWPEGAPRAADAARPVPRRWGWPVVAVTLIYSVGALGLLPHMVFFVDFIARGLGQGVTTGSLLWVVFGLGATAGPVIAGRVGDRIGFGRALPLALLLQLAAVLVPLTAPHLLPLAVSALVMGAFTPGMPSLVLGRLQEVAPGPDQHTVWGRATTAFALGQAGGAYALSWTFAETGSYAALFLLGAIALAAALVLAVATAGSLPAVRTRTP